MQRYFLENNINIIDNTYFELPIDIKHYFIDVMRNNVGSKAEFVIKDTNNIIVAEVVNISEDIINMKKIKTISNNTEFNINSTVIIGLTKKNKPEIVIQKITELGIKNIIIVETRYSVVKWDKNVEKKLQRLNKVAESAAEQCHRNEIPTITYVKNINELKFANDDIKLVAWEEDAKIEKDNKLHDLLLEAKDNKKDVVFFIGPEGGLTQKEITFLEGKGFITISLGKRILRAETAAIYCASILGYILEIY